MNMNFRCMADDALHIGGSHQSHVRLIQAAVRASNDLAFPSRSLRVYRCPRGTDAALECHFDYI